MNLLFTKHEVVLLKSHPGLSEKWLQKTIAADPSIVGLGDLEIIDRERIQEHAGRLDLLLTDGDSTRYEVELMLGPTDPSHIIRCIEYWDNERRRYPGYEHIAVLIAENITARFLNVLSLMAGNIPLIAIQLCALRVEDRLVLNFVPVLNQTNLRRDDETVSAEQETDRPYWNSRVGPEIMSIADGILELVNNGSESPLELRHLKNHLAISVSGDWRNRLVMWPKKQYLHVQTRLPNPDDWVAKIEEVGLPVSKRRQNRVRVTVSPTQFQQHREVLRELLQSGVGSDEGDD